MSQSQVPEISDEAIAGSIGVLIIQMLDFYASELDLSKSDIKSLWSPFLAATTRVVKPADDIVDIYRYSAKNPKAQGAIIEEIDSPYTEFYEPFNQSLQSFLKTIAESVAEFSYLASIEKRGLVNKPEMAAELTDMLKFYFEDQNSKGRKRMKEDSMFISLVSTALPQHVDDTFGAHRINGKVNTGKSVQLGQVIFATAVLLQIIKGML
jgi:hypothetical protein